MQCRKCGRGLPENAGFCPFCGTVHIIKKRCPQCGAELMDGAAFCFRCGAAAGSAESADNGGSGSASGGNASDFEFEQNRDGLTIVKFKGKNIHSVKVPMYVNDLPVTEVYLSAFADIDRMISSISIPAGVHRIYSWKHAMMMCAQGLRDIEVDSGNSEYVSLNGVLYTRDRKALISFPPAKTGESGLPAELVRIEDCAFLFCGGLVEVSVPKSITFIGDAAFACCKSLRRITVPESVEHIGEGAFRSCSSLVSAAIPAKFGDRINELFEDCTAIKDIRLTKNGKSVKVMYFPLYRFSSENDPDRWRRATKPAGDPQSVSRRK